MKKLIILLVITMLVLAGCGSSNNVETNPQAPQETPPQEAAEEDDVTTIDDVVRLFQAEGLEVGIISVKAFDIIGAIDGFGVEIEDIEIELYQFDPETADEETMALIEEAKEKGQMTMFDNSFPVLYHEELDIALFGHEQHPQGEKIAEIFKNIR